MLVCITKFIIFIKNLGEGETVTERSSASSLSPPPPLPPLPLLLAQQSATLINDENQNDNLSPSKLNSLHHEQIHNPNVNNDNTSLITSCNIDNNDFINDSTTDINLNDNVSSKSPSLALSLPLSSPSLCAAAAYKAKQKYLLNTTVDAELSSSFNNNDINNAKAGNNIINCTHSTETNTNLNHNLSSVTTTSTTSSSSCYNTLNVADALTLTKSSKDTDEKEI